MNSLSSVYHSQFHEDAVDLRPQAKVVQEALELFPGELLQLDPVCLEKTNQMDFKHFDYIHYCCQWLSSSFLNTKKDSDSSNVWMSVLTVLLDFLE